jgi:hypothetical protein
VTRRRQDFLTWLLAAGLLISQAMPWVPERPYIIAGAFGLLGLPSIRKVQEAVNQEEVAAEEAEIEPKRVPKKRGPS